LWWAVSCERESKKRGRTGDLGSKSFMGYYVEEQKTYMHQSPINAALLQGTAYTEKHEVHVSSTSSLITSISTLFPGNRMFKI
jgi:hypothetical protein